MKNKITILLCLSGGILMILGSFVGNFIFFDYPFILGAPLIGEVRNSDFSKILFIFEYLPFFGGISIISGLLIIELEYPRLGNDFITLGVLFNIIGLSISVLIGIIIQIVFVKFETVLVYFISLYGGFEFIGLIIIFLIRGKLSVMNNFFS